MRRDEFEENQRLRQLVPAPTDRHLANWGRWRRSGMVGRGYPSRSSGISTGGESAYDAFDHLVEEDDVRSAEVTDNIIDELVIQHKIAISYVYEAAVWEFKRRKIEDVLVEAVTVFWGKAKKRGLT